MTTQKQPNKRWISDMFFSLRAAASLENLKEAIKVAEAAVQSGQWKDLHVKPYLPDPYEEYYFIGIFGERPETDQELDTRLKQEERWRLAAEKQESAEFERLKKKFEKKG